MVSYVPELVVDNGNDFILGLLLNQCVENNDLSESTEPSHKSIRVARAGRSINNFYLSDVYTCLLSLLKNGISQFTLL